MRMSIHAMTMSDICDAASERITKEAWELTGSNGLREDLKGWPRNPPKFTKSQKELWKNTLMKVFGRRYVDRDSRSIAYNYRVGNWLERSTKSKYKTFHSVRENRLYLKENNYWRVYRSDNPRTMRIGNGRYT